MLFPRPGRPRENRARNRATWGRGWRVSVGAPGGNRTPDPRIRSPTLYPAELQAHQALYDTPAPRGPPAITKRDGASRSLLHSGHLDGLSSRVRSLKTNPQARHRVGSTCNRSPLCLSERARCARWPATSFSLIPTRAESSRAVSGRSPSTRLSSDRIVTCRSDNSGGDGFFANGRTSDQKPTGRRGQRPLRPAPGRSSPSGSHRRGLACPWRPRGSPGPPSRASAPPPGVPGPPGGASPARPS